MERTLVNNASLTSLPVREGYGNICPYTWSCYGSKNKDIFENMCSVNGGDGCSCKATQTLDLLLGPHIDII